MEARYYSEEVQFIMNKVPSSVVRLGISIIFLILVIILVGCYFVKYPEIVSVRASISTINPPTDLISKNGGLIDHIYIHEGSVVKKGDVLAVLKNAAEWQDVEFISKRTTDLKVNDILSLITNDWIYNSYHLGELQSSFSEFQSLCEDFSHYIQVNNLEVKINLLKKQISKNKEYYGKLEKQGRWVSEEVNIEKRNLHRDSILLKCNTISLSDYESSSKQLIDKQYNRAGFDANLTQTELQILQNKQQIEELTMQQANEIADYKNKIVQAGQRLTAQIVLWEQTYIFRSPIDGKVTLGSIWAKGQYVNVGQRFASVISVNKMKVIGKLQVPSSGIGKIKLGQVANVKLSGFSFIEYGALKGRITSIAKIPDAAASGTAIVYIVDIDFPNGLVTNYNKKLPLIQSMDGTADIITDDTRLIQQFVKPVMSLYKE